MLQRVLLHSDTQPKMVAQLEKELIDKFRGDVDSAIVPRLVNAIYPHVPDSLDTEFSLKTLEDYADRCGLDLSVKGIKSRNPPGDKSWKDPQRQLYDETVATILVLKVFHLRNISRFPTDESFLAEFPELEKAFAFTSDYTDADIKRRKELDKIRTHKDLSTERLLCNVMDIIATLYKNAKKVFKTQCIYLVADVAGDCRGHLGRDPSPSTLRLILYFERVTGITKRPARPLKPSVSDDHLLGGGAASSSSSSSGKSPAHKSKGSSSSKSRSSRKAGPLNPGNPLQVAAALVASAQLDDADVQPTSIRVKNPSVYGNPSLDHLRTSMFNMPTDDIDVDGGMSSDVLLLMNIMRDSKAASGSSASGGALKRKASPVPRGRRDVSPEKKARFGASSSSSSSSSKLRNPHHPSYADSSSIGAAGGSAVKRGGPRYDAPLHPVPAPLCAPLCGIFPKCAPREPLALGDLDFATPESVTQFYEKFCKRPDLSLKRSSVIIGDCQKVLLNPASAAEIGMDSDSHRIGLYDEFQALIMSSDKIFSRLVPCTLPGVSDDAHEGVNVVEMNVAVSSSSSSSSKQPTTDVLPATKEPPIAIVPASAEPAMDVVPAINEPPINAEPVTKESAMDVVPATKEPTVDAEPATKEPPIDAVPATKEPSMDVVPAPKEPSKTNATDFDAATDDEGEDGSGHLMLSQFSGLDECEAPNSQDIDHLVATTSTNQGNQDSQEEELFFCFGHELVTWSDPDLFAGVVELNSKIERFQGKLQGHSVQIKMQEQTVMTESSITTSSSCEISRPKMDGVTTSPQTNGGPVLAALVPLSTAFNQLRKMMQFGMKHYVVTNRMKRLSGVNDMIKKPMSTASSSSSSQSKFDCIVHKFGPTK